MQKNVSPVAFRQLDWHSALRHLLLLLCAAGVGIWGALLFAPKPGPLPPALPQATAQGVNTAAVANWFGGGTTRVRVSVAGLMATDTGGAALLAVNGAAPQAYRVGQVLAPGVTLAEVRADGVSVDQDGAIERLPAPARPATVDGFLPVPPEPGRG